MYHFIHLGTGKRHLDGRQHDGKRVRHGATYAFFYDENAHQRLVALFFLFAAMGNHALWYACMYLLSAVYDATAFKMEWIKLFVLWYAAAVTVSLRNGTTIQKPIN